MFARFRQTKSTLQVSLLDGRRVDGRVRQEHVASLGAIGLPMDVEGRERFWIGLHQTFSRLGNRVDAATQAKIMEAVHARILMVAPDERQAYEIELAEREQEAWADASELYADFAKADSIGAEGLTAKAAGEQQFSDTAKGYAAEAANRLERLRRGESAPRGVKIDLREILKAAGWTEADRRHALTLAKLGEDRIEEFYQAASTALRPTQRRTERAIARRLLRDQQKRS